MPVEFDVAAISEEWSLDDFTSAMAGWHFDIDAPVESYEEAAPALKRLSNNKGFLVELILRDVKEGLLKTDRLNLYSPQVVMVVPSNGEYYVRAVYWPSGADPITGASAATNLAYGYPHDHNFSFLTSGYLGPGYVSDYYEYDYSSVAGNIGERVSLRSTGRERLEPDMVVAYRAHVDVHNQYPPEELSVTLNLIGAHLLHEFRHQYRFDLSDGAVLAGAVNRIPSANLVHLACALGDEEVTGVVREIAASHPSDLVRVAAFDGLLGVADADQRAELLDEGRRNGRRYVRDEIARLAAQQGGT